MNALPANPSPPETTSAPAFVANEDVLLVIVVVPPINALPVNPNPPSTTNPAEVVEVAFTSPLTVTPDPTTVSIFVPFTAVPFAR